MNVSVNGSEDGSVNVADVVKDVAKKDDDVVKDFSLNISANDNENVCSANNVNVAKDVVKELLLFIEADGFVTAETLAEKLSMSARQVQRLMAQLQKDNLIT